jgi:hypothetical protein
VVEKADKEHVEKAEVERAEEGEEGGWSWC